MTDATPDVPRFAVHVTIDGTTWIYRPYRLTAALAQEFREQTRRSLGEMWATVWGDSDELIGLEEIAQMAFLARRQAGERVNYADLAQSTTGEQAKHVEFVLEEDADLAAAAVDSPEA